MDTKQRLKLELQALVDKWKDKTEPLFMSKEYIARRFDRIRYLKIRRQLNSLSKSKDDLAETVKKVFNVS